LRTVLLGWKVLFVLIVVSVSSRRARPGEAVV
jgi:hypothetical protein